MINIEINIVINKKIRKKWKNACFKIVLTLKGVTPLNFESMSNITNREPLLKKDDVKDR